MALVDHDEVEKVRRVVAEIGGRIALGVRAAHERLEDGEEQAAVFRHFAFLADVLGLDAHHRVLGKCRESVVGLIGEQVAVREEKDSRPARRFTGQIPSRMEKLPRDLERDERLACAGGEREQNPFPLLRDGVEHPLDGDVLVIPARMRTALVLKGHRSEAVPPSVLLREGHLPKLLG